MGIASLNHLLDTYPVLLDIAQVSEVLRVSNSGIYRLVRVKTIRSLRIGKKILIPREYIVEYINAQTL